MNPSSEPRPERLIAEQDWVRPLVQRLVRDEASAQDVLQSAWLRTLRRPPVAQAGSRSWRSWFLRVAHNLARRQGEREGARREREQRAARGEAIPSTLEIAEREELRAQIVAHVLALPEPYRTTLVLRFYEGLEPRAIARAQGTNGSTVRNRIARGLGLLRERMERAKGGNWVSCCLALLPLASAQLLVAHAGWTGWTGWIAKGGVVLKKIEIAAAAALVTAAGAVWFAWPSGAGPDAAGTAGATGIALSSENGGLALPRRGGAAEEALAGSEDYSGTSGAAQPREPVGGPLAAAGSGVRVFGIVRDARGTPINQGGGTFQLQMGRPKSSPDIPVVEFLVADGQPRQNLDLDLKLAVRQLEEPRVTAAQDLAINVDQLRIDSLLSTFRLEGSTRILLADSEGCQYFAVTNIDSTFSAEGLHAGKWRAIVTHEGKLCRRQEFEIPAGEPQYRLDFVLDDPLAVKVKLRTPDGRELMGAIAADPELSAHVVLVPVALRPGSAARQLPDGGDPNFGCGTYRSRAQLDESHRALIGEASGVLTIREAPPLEVGLALCGQLIARLPLAPAQEEVEFVLSIDDLRRRFTTVIVRVVDAQTRAPIAGAGVSMDGTRPQVLSLEAEFSAVILQGLADRANQKRAVEADERRARGLVTDADGIVQIPWVVPGLRRVFVSIHSHAPFGGRFEIEPGPIRELPPIELTGQARIRGRVRGAQGELAQARLQLVPLDRFEETHEDTGGSFWQSSGQGELDIPNQRRERYVLRACEGEQGLVPLVVDASGGDVDELELQLVAPGRATLFLTREPKEGAELRISTGGGLPVLERDLAGLAPAELSLAPGAYFAEVREGRRRAGSVRFAVGKNPVRVVLPLD